MPERHERLGEVAAWVVCKNESRQRRSYSLWDNIYPRKWVGQISPQIVPFFLSQDNFERVEVEAPSQLWCSVSIIVSLSEFAYVLILSSASIKALTVFKMERFELNTSKSVAYVLINSLKYIKA